MRLLDWNDIQSIPFGLVFDILEMFLFLIYFIFISKWIIYLEFIFIFFSAKVIFIMIHFECPKVSHFYIIFQGKMFLQL